MQIYKILSVFVLQCFLTLGGNVWQYEKLGIMEPFPVKVHGT